MPTEQLPLLARDQQLQNPSSSSSSNAARRQRRQKRIGRATIGFTIAVLATLALMGIVSLTSTKSASSTELETIMEAYRARRFSGVVRLSHNGERKFSDWMGLANEEFAVPMEKHSVFPIGSNSKLFTAVAMLQLQERGRVNLSHPVNDYLDPADFASFGFANQTRWCPHVRANRACETVTFVQLLNMGSGMGDGVLCDNAVAPYCSELSADLTHYRGSIAKHVGAFINAPLAFQPGTNYSYANANYVLLSYLVEKLSGQRLEVYLREQIFDKIGLKKTYYDPYAGARFVHRGFVSQYADFYAAQPDQSSASGSQDERQSPAYLATGTCGPDANSGALSGAGGIHSSVKDMHRVYKDLFLHRGQQSKVLSEASIRSLLLTRNPVQSEHALGINVAFESEGQGGREAAAESEWPSKISYCGRLRCAVTCMAMQTLGADSVVASAFTNHVEYTFPTSDAFAQWQPSDELTASSSSSVGFQAGDYQVAELSWSLLDVFLRYFQANELS